MQLKKWGILVLCSLMLTAFAGCTPKEEEPPQTKIEEPKTEEPKQELSREIKKSDPERRKYFNDEVIELYPEIGEMKAYLFEKYADVLPPKEAKLKTGKPVVDIGYWGGGEFS